MREFFNKALMKFVLQGLKQPGKFLLIPVQDVSELATIKKDLEDILKVLPTGFVVKGNVLEGKYWLLNHSMIQLKVVNHNDLRGLNIDYAFVDDCVELNADTFDMLRERTQNLIVWTTESTMLDF